MLRIFLVRADGTLVHGDEELLDQWRQSPDSRIWVDMHEVSEEEEDRIFEVFDIHHLVVSDSRRERHPPKLEVFDHFIFILLKGLDAESEDLDFGTIQLSMFAGERFLVTRHDKKSVSVGHWSESPQLRHVLKESGIHLALELSKSTARRYLELLLNFEPRLAELEDLLQERPDDELMRELTGYRTRLRKMRRDFNYHASVFAALREEETPFFHGKKGRFKHFVTDVHDKYDRLLSLCTMYYEQAGDLVDGYISLTSHEMNKTVKVLTVLTAIFVPLTFLAGIYGMNFDYMPELRLRWGYFALLAVMGTIIVVLLAAFRARRWL